MRSCISFLQRLETETAAANLLNREATGISKSVKNKNKGRRELRNLISSVNYDGR